ncbi:hypothetical protein WMY93_006865 [Mugilogobius chulae]|uniref:LEM domain-containing protein n=1 Tax=Mugilogobius chulae TaxID=88201 RepID=A0AAW0PLB4_9GOBI
MSLSEKSDSELTELLSQFGVKHGPIVESTRKLYEKKLEKAMEAAAAAQTSPSSDKTYYREEEVVTYITYHSPTRSEAPADMLRHRGASEKNEINHQDTTEPELQQESAVQASTRKLDHGSAPSRVQEKRSGPGCVRRLLRLLLVLALLAGVSYYVFCRVLSSEESREIV